MEKQKKVKKKISKKRKFFRIVFRFFIFFLFIFLLIFAIRNSRIFNIKSVNVEGTKNISYKDVIKVAELKKGSKYYSISKADRIKKIESIPYVKSAKINFRLGGTVNVSIKERTPYYQAYSSKYLLIDEDFRILEERDSKADNLLNLDGLNLENNKAGSFILSYKEDVDKKELLKSLKNPEYNLLGNIESIELLDSVATFMTIDGIKVEFGSYSNIDYKLRMLSLILDDIKKTNKKATVIQMEKGTNPILIVEDDNGKKDKDEKNSEKNEKSYIEEKANSNSNWFFIRIS